MEDLTISDVDACRNPRKNKAVLISSQSTTKNVKRTQWDFNQNGTILIKIKWSELEQKQSLCRGQQPNLEIRISLKDRLRNNQLITRV